MKDAGISFVELGGVEANPKVSLARKAAKLAREEKVDLILAVGGGSVLDSSKAAAAGAYYNCDPWEFSTKKRIPEKCPSCRDNPHPRRFRQRDERFLRPDQ